jgi:hypothetical protein
MQRQQLSGRFSFGRNKKIRSRKFVLNITRVSLIQKKNTNGNLAGGPEVEEGGNKKNKTLIFFLENVGTFRENVGQHFHGKRCKILMKHLGKMLNLTFSLQKCCRTLPGKMLVQHFR